MLVYYFVPFIVSNLYLLFWVSNSHNSVTVQNRTHVYMNFFDHKDLGNHLLQLCPKVVKHSVYARCRSRKHMYLRRICCYVPNHSRDSVIRNINMPLKRRYYLITLAWCERLVRGLAIAIQEEWTYFPNMVKVKQSHYRAWTGPEGSRRSRLPDFKTIGTWRW